MHEDVTSVGCHACLAAATAAEMVQVTATIQLHTGICYLTPAAICTVATQTQH